MAEAPRRVNSRSGDGAGTAGLDHRDKSQPGAFMSLRRFALIVFSLAGTSCADDPVDPGPTVPPPPLASIPLSLCHRDANGTTVLEVSEPALSTHLGHGDYRTELRVDHGTPPTGWEVGVRFNRISDAVQSARDTRIQNQENVAGACRITIEVARGTYTGTTDPTGDPGLERFPLLIDVPDITLRGSMRMS